MCKFKLNCLKVNVAGREIVIRVSRLGFGDDTEWTITREYECIFPCVLEELSLEFHWWIGIKI